MESYPIPFFEEQQHQVPEWCLRHLGAMFTRHGVHERYGLSLLHRHHEQESGKVMVHRVTDTGDEISLPEDFDTMSPSVVPRQYRVTSQNLIPVEYIDMSGGGSGDKIGPPSESFSSELWEFLEQNELDSVLGVSLLPDPLRQRTEYMLESQRGTVATCDGDVFGSGVTTEWAFHDDRGCVDIISVTKCNPIATGVHEPK